MAYAKEFLTISHNSQDYIHLQQCYCHIQDRDSKSVMTDPLRWTDRALKEPIYHLDARWRQAGEGTGCWNGDGGPSMCSPIRKHFRTSPPGRLEASPASQPPPASCSFFVSQTNISQENNTVLRQRAFFVLHPVPEEWKPLPFSENKC